MDFNLNGTFTEWNKPNSLFQNEIDNFVKRLDQIRAESAQNNQSAGTNIADNATAEDLNNKNARIIKWTDGTKLPVGGQTKPAPDPTHPETPEVAYRAQQYDPDYRYNTMKIDIARGLIGTKQAYMQNQAMLDEANKAAQGGDALKAYQAKYNLSDGQVDAAIKQQQDDANRGMALASKQAADYKFNAHRREIDVTNYGSGVSLDDALMSLSNESRNAINELINGNKYNRTSGEFFDDTYDELRQQGYSHMDAMHFASRAAAKYQANRLAAYQQGFLAFGRDGDKLSNAGIDLLTKIQQERPSDVGMYWQGYAHPANQFANDFQTLTNEIAFKHGLNTLTHQADLNDQLAENAFGRELKKGEIQHQYTMEKLREEIAARERQAELERQEWYNRFDYEYNKKSEDERNRLKGFEEDYRKSHPNATEEEVFKAVFGYKYGSKDKSENDTISPFTATFLGRITNAILTNPAELDAIAEEIDLLEHDHSSQWYKLMPFEHEKIKSQLATALTQRAEAQKQSQAAPKTNNSADNPPSGSSGTHPIGTQSVTSEDDRRTTPFNWKKNYERYKG